MYLGSKTADELKGMAKRLVVHGDCANRDHSQRYSEIVTELKARSLAGGSGIPGNLTQAQINRSKELGEHHRQAREASARRQSLGLEAPDEI